MWPVPLIVSSVWLSVSPLLLVNVGWRYSTEGQEATSSRNTSLHFSWGCSAVSCPPSHQSCLLVVYSTCNGNGCPWRTGCCWTLCEPDLTSQVWKKNKKRKRRRNCEITCLNKRKHGGNPLARILKVNSFPLIFAWICRSHCGDMNIQYVIFAFWIPEQSRN